MPEKNLSSAANTAKYALVTGASRGIGRAIAERLAKEGFHLYLTCRQSADLLSSLANDLADRYHISCLPFVADMGNPSDVENKNKWMILTG